jgi:hypothetical protein
MNTHSSIANAYNDMDKIHSIERERNKTMSDPKYIQWVRELRVSQLYTNRELIHNANRLMKQYTHKIGLDS